MSDAIVKEVTDEFCESYRTKDDCRDGWSAATIPYCLPECVDPSDPRVIQIVEWCKEVAEEQAEYEGDE